MTASTRLESARAWATFAYEGWRGRATDPPDRPLSDEDIRRLGVSAFLFRALRSCDDARANRFASGYRHAATANLIRLAHGARLRDALEDRGIRPVLLKGGAFVVRFAYDDLGVRPMADLDLLVAPEECDEAAAVLRAFGLQDAGIRPSSRATHASSFTSTHGAVTLDIDLHRGLAAWPMAPGLAARILSTHDVVEGWRVPACPDAFSVTALHRARHGFVWSAVDLFELKQMAEVMDAEAWGRMLEGARRAQLTGAVWAVWRQALAWLGATDPDRARLEDLAAATGLLRRSVLSRIAPDEGLLAHDVRWTQPLLRSFVVGPAAMATPARAVAAALRFLPLRAWEEWTTARQHGLGSTASLRWLLQYAWRGASAPGSAGRSD